MPDYLIDPMPPRISREVLALLGGVETATVGHWRHWGFVDRAVRAVLPGRRIVGTAVTVAIPGPDSTLLHHALSLARPGDVLVVDRLGDDRHACWGGGVTIAAKVAGVVAGIVDGPCTDREEIEASDFPLWCRGMAPITTRQMNLGGMLNRPVAIGGAVVMAGDVVLADDSGVLILRADEAEAVARQALDRQKHGEARQDELRAGRKIGDMSGATAKVLAALAGG